MVFYTMESKTFTHIFPKLALKKLVAQKLETSFLGKLITAREKGHGNAQLGNPREKEPSQMPCTIKRSTSARGTSNWHITDRLS